MKFLDEYLMLCHSLEWSSIQSIGVGYLVEIFGLIQPLLCHLLGYGFSVEEASWPQLDHAQSTLLATMQELVKFRHSQGPLLQ